MTTTLPPFFPGTMDAPSWTGPIPLDATGEANTGTPHDYTNGAEGAFSGGSYQSNATYSPTVSYKQLLTTTAGRRYTLELVVIKLDSGADSFVKPGFINVTAGSAISMTGSTSGPGFQSSSGNLSSYDTSTWNPGTAYTLRPYWVAPSALNVRVRCRFNRRQLDVGLGTGGSNPSADNSDASFKLVSFKFFAEIHLKDLQTEFGGPTPIKLKNYYRGGSYVADTPTNSRIPTSGTINFSDFFGGQFSAITPDVTLGPMAWSSFGASGPTDDTTLPGTSIAATSTTQTVNGVNQPITLLITSGTAMDTGEQFQVYVNGSVAGAMLTGNTSTTVTVNNGDTVFFVFGGYGTSGVTVGHHITVFNNTDSNAYVSDFTASLTKTN
jgi:hypothetical protein